MDEEHNRLIERIEISVREINRKIRFISHKFGSLEAVDQTKQIVAE